MNDISKVEANAESNRSNADNATVPAQDAAGDTARKTTRKRLFIGIASVSVILGGAYYAYDTLIASHHVVTDDAYVGADVAQVTPLVNGPVEQVMVQDTAHVVRGQVLVRLDDTNTRLALTLAEANLDRARRQVQTYIANDADLAAQIAARQADEAKADAQYATAAADLKKARVELRRRQNLATSGGISGDELTNEQNEYATAVAELASAVAAQASSAANYEAALSARAENAAMIDGTTVETNPAVLVAKESVDQARVDLGRTVIRAPVDGIVTGRQVQVGQQVTAGTMLMDVVPINNVYVDANYKEVQLDHVHAGQEVTMTSDLYGGNVVYHGHVTGFSGGTGDAFAVVPAQNATGNWIKVVQRLPVRIALDARELAAHPLRVGLSMTTDIHVGG
jgi:membrane fusion protein (multidrug efflux system)